MRREARTNRQHRAPRQGISLVELLIVMSAATVILTITAGLVHRIMFAHSKTRAFVDAERTSLRLANTFRGDVHQAIAATVVEPPPAEGAFLQLELPGGQRLEYRRKEAAILRVLLDQDQTVSREAFIFPAKIEVAIKKDSSRLVAMSVSSRPPDAPSEDGGSPPPAYAVPVHVHVEAALHRDAPDVAVRPAEGGAP